MIAQPIVVLPRGLNVGRANRVPMPALRAALTAAGAPSVQTVLASGNIVLDAESVAAARDLVEDVLAQRFEIAVPVVARTGADLRRVLATDPFGAVAEDDSRTLVNFLDRRPDPHRYAEFATEVPEPERTALDGTEIHVWAPGGVQNLWASYSRIERRLDVVATARNRRTLPRIAAVLEP